MLPDQVLGCFNGFVWEAQALKHFLGHLGPHDLMAVEMRPFLRARLPDVVKQSCQAQAQVAGRSSVEGGEAMPPDVVGMPFILLDTDTLDQLRPQVNQDPGLLKEL